MARTIQDETLDLIQSGLVIKAVDNKFNKRVRNVDQDPMDVDDEFVIPANYEVLEMSINGSEPTPFILVPMTNIRTNVTRNIRFFPNMLAKIVFPVVNGQTQPKVKTVGSAALEYQKYADKGNTGMDEAVQALVGRKIRITAKTPYTVKEYGTGNEVTTNLYTYDFA